MADGGAVQWGLDGLVTVALAIGSAVVKAIRDDHKDLRREHDELAGEIPRTYARRDDVREGFLRIEAKLDRLIERRYGPPDRAASGDDR